jgi:hypothetical protein
MLFWRTGESYHLSNLVDLTDHDDYQTSTTSLACLE